MGISDAPGTDRPEINGRYFSRFNANGREHKQARDHAIIDGLWERSAALVGLT